MKINIISRIMLLFAAMMLVGSVHVPIWQIDLDAPQYPEGLRLLIYADEIGGDVEIINGLNHYIGMKTLHTDDFFEFTILPYILYAFAGLSLLVMLIGKRSLLYALLITFALFGIVSMVDFWRWEYNYGHNLDPNAAIIVPGMAYQPPLIGFKQLLNFGAYSMPTVGGWLLVGSGLLFFIASFYESGLWKRFGKKSAGIAVLLLGVQFAACGQPGSRPIQVNRDACTHCKMSISDLKYSAEAVNKNNKVFVFDDIKCLLQYIKQDQKLDESLFFIADFNNETAFIPAKQAWYVSGGKLSSPMGGNIAAFKEKSVAEKFAAQQGGNVLNWEQVKSK